MNEKVKEEFINDKEANILINAYKNNEVIFGQSVLGDVKVCCIKDGLCKVKFEKGKIEYYRNQLFDKTIID